MRLLLVFPGCSLLEPTDAEYHILSDYIQSVSSRLATHAERIPNSRDYIVIREHLYPPPGRTMLYSSYLTALQRPYPMRIFQVSRIRAAFLLCRPVEKISIHIASDWSRTRIRNQRAWSV